MNISPILFPLIVPLIGVILLLVGSRSLAVQRAGGLIFANLTFFSALYLLFKVDAAGHIVLQSGDWEAPFGISLVADRFSAVMVAISSFMGAAVAIYSISDIDEKRLRRFFFPLYLILMVGVNGALLTGDLFNLFVWFEVMLIASFVMVTMGGKKAELEGGLKYVCLNLFSSMLFLAGAGIIYGKTGTLNMADIAQSLNNTTEVGWVVSSSMLLFVSFALKSGMFPFFFWLPAVYHTPPSAVTAIFAGLLTKVGVYALFRSYTLLFVPVFPEMQSIILVLAVLTMVVGVLGAASLFDISRILSFHIISQIGYIVLGLAFMTPLALAASIFYLLHNIIAKTNLFLISGIVVRLKGTSDLSKIGGLSKSAPWLAWMFFISAFALAGIPPLSGFWAKLAVVKAGMEVGSWIAITAALLVGVMTLFSMTKIWAEAFWKAQPEGVTLPDTSKPVGPLIFMIVPVATLALMSILLGVFGEPVFAFAERAADQLLNPSEYIQAVLPHLREVNP